ncbi:PP2C family protein-serine/threonine phosphatase [Subtercola boreus]|uniref:PPM-type phosphatase domain-containing protein n=1 Tax=Subtercola boreus TaxID=120213 RepID=A0A3E0WBJ4_9MICO|nr:protein phosphatase 2C domain-containing protein [Subtercola boreus]RFA19417.1 hypothetical protein B7R24_12320 [Subtercola boreus]RFA19678.1 hypothetical protein B7R23_12300 [Subtercola boreus]RFA26043.1 hypothetical protein B7R25_12420 [Subtercola boreus]
MASALHQTAPIEVRWGAATDTGRTRAINEDAFLADAPVFVVADGMGGHEAGEVASAIAVSWFEAFVGLRSVDPAQVRVALAEAQREISQLVATTERSAGTTLTGVMVTEIESRGYWLVVNVGDSRTYRLAHGALTQISVDHSVIQELLEAGELDARLASQHPQRNVITRALGAGDPADPDFWLLPAELGDRILVCSDGLTNELGDDRIRSILTDEPDPNAAAVRLLRESLLHGGRDNLTVLVIDAVSVSGDDSDFARGFDTVPVTFARMDADDTIPRTPRSRTEQEH